MSSHKNRSLYAHIDRCLLIVPTPLHVGSPSGVPTSGWPLSSAKRHVKMVYCASPLHLGAACALPVRAQHPSRTKCAEMSSAARCFVIKSAGFSTPGILATSTDLSRTSSCIHSSLVSRCPDLAYAGALANADGGGGIQVDPQSAFPAKVSH